MNARNMHTIAAYFAKTLASHVLNLWPPPLLQVVGRIHVGHTINRMRHGSLVMRLPDSEVASIPTMLYGTVDGTIGLVAFLPKELYDFLSRLQGCLRKVRGGSTLQAPEVACSRPPCLPFATPLFGHAHKLDTLRLLFALPVRSDQFGACSLTAIHWRLVPGGQMCLSPSFTPKGTCASFFLSLW